MKEYGSEYGKEYNTKRNWEKNMKEFMCCLEDISEDKSKSTKGLVKSEHSRFQINGMINERSVYETNSGQKINEKSKKKDYKIKLNSQFNEKWKPPFEPKISKKKKTQNSKEYLSEEFEDKWINNKTSDKKSVKTMKFEKKYMEEVADKSINSGNLAGRKYKYRANDYKTKDFSEGILEEENDFDFLKDFKGEYDLILNKGEHTQRVNISLENTEMETELDSEITEKIQENYILNKEKHGDFTINQESKEFEEEKIIKLEKKAVNTEISNTYERIKLNDNDLEKVREELREKGYTLRQISEEIGADIKSALYRGYRLKNEVVEKLENLIGREISREENVKKTENFNQIKVEKSELKNIYKDLKSRGYSINKISKAIRTQFGNALHKGYSMNEQSFRKLTQLYGKEITHQVIEKIPKTIIFEEKNLRKSVKNLETYNRVKKDNTIDVIIPKNSIEFKESEKLAEFTGISLGDGSIPKDMYKITITSDSKEEIKYIQYTKEMMEGLFNKKVSTIPHIDSRASDLVVYGKDVVEGLVKKGLTTGNKVKKQVDVPEWILKKPIYQRDCLRGLTDTDGSIFVKKAQKSIRIGFQNHSKPLAKNFRDMCQALNIKTGNVTTYQRIKDNKVYYQHDVLISGKKEVSKFLDKVKPKKWEYRAETIGLTLVSLENPQKREAIEKELDKVYPDKKVHYNSEYKDFLKVLCIKHGYDVSKETIFKVIENALTNKNTGKLSIYGKNVIMDLKR